MDKKFRNILKLLKILKILKVNKDLQRFPLIDRDCQNFQRLKIFWKMSIKVFRNRNRNKTTRNFFILKNRNGIGRKNKNLSFEDISDQNYFLMVFALHLSVSSIRPYTVECGWNLFAACLYVYLSITARSQAFLNIVKS